MDQTYANKHVEIGQTGKSESDSNNDHQNTDENLTTSGLIRANGVKSKDQSTGSHASDAKSVQSTHQHLKEKDKEKDHEVEGAVVPEGLVGRAEPANK